MSNPLAIIRPSATRRAVGVAAHWGLGGMLFVAGIVDPPADAGWQILLLLVGLVLLALGEALRRASGRTLVLTEDTLSDDHGRVLARCDDIRAVGRAVVGLRPSNGFSLTLSASAPAAWAPGLWWRIGRRIGVGGVTPAYQSKIMAEAISQLIASRPGAGRR